MSVPGIVTHNHTEKILNDTSISNLLPTLLQRCEKFSIQNYFGDNC